MCLYELRIDGLMPLLENQLLANFRSLVEENSHSKDWTREGKTEIDGA